MEVPNYIWMYWHQGIDNSPKIVQQCALQWKRINPRWEIRILDDLSIKELVELLPISSVKLSKMTIAHRSDLFRTQLLIKYGGVWADPTTYPIVPLDEWLPNYMTSGVFFFQKPGRDRIVSNWFIVASPNNYLLRKLYEELIAYWNDNDFRNLGREFNQYELLLNRLVNRNLQFPRLWFTGLFRKVIRLYPYMIYHYKFYDLIQTEPKCKIIWNKTPEFCAKPLHHLQNLGLLIPLTKETKYSIDHSTVPMYKLTWKLPLENIPEGSVLHYLFNFRGA